MPAGSRADLLQAVAARVVDLRAEFEAQLRAVGCVQEHMRRVDAEKSDNSRRLDETLERDLTETLRNNRNIRTVFDDLANEVRNASKA